MDVKSFNKRSRYGNITQIGFDIFITIVKFLRTDLHHERQKTHLGYRENIFSRAAIYQYIRKTQIGKTQNKNKDVFGVL